LAYKNNQNDTSPNLSQRTTVWNTNAPNHYITRWLFVSDCSRMHHQFWS